MLFLFTGPHDDYHRPSDTWDKINPPGLATVATLAARVVDTVARAATAPAWVNGARRVVSRPARQRLRRVLRRRPRFRRSGGEGAAGQDANQWRAGRSPAEKAGLKGGDVIVRFAGVNVRTLEDFAFALRGRRAGDQVQVVVRRDGNEQPLQAVLEERR